MDWYTASALTAQQRAELARDAALVRAGRAVRNRKARKGAGDEQANGDVATKERRKRMLKLVDSHVSRWVCRRCGLPVDHLSEAVSRHRTSDGTVIYTRCVCGLLQVWLDAVEPGSARHVTLIRPLEADDRQVS